MTAESENPEYSKYQNSSPNSKEINNYKEHIISACKEALDNTETPKALSITMNYSLPNTKNLEEHLDLPGSNYEIPIEELLEENEDSKDTQPTQGELDLQNKRTLKAQEALIKLKTQETPKKLSKHSYPQAADKPKKVQKKEFPSIQKKNSPPHQSQKPKLVKSKSKPAPFIVDSSESQGTLALQIEKPIKATSQAPNNKSFILPLKLSNSQDLEAKKLEEITKIKESHKASMAKLRSIFDGKRRKAEQDKKTMIEMQIKLLHNERNYVPPNRTRDRVKTAPPPPPAAKPRALNQDCYKLHQLAASTGSTEARLTADKLGGSMLQAIKILSAKTSEEFIHSEILEEEKRLAESKKLLHVGKDMKRGEVDYHEESRKKIIIYQNLILEHKTMLQRQAEHLKVQDSLIERLKKLEMMKAVVKLGDGKYMRAGMVPDALIDTLSELESVGSEVMKEDPLDRVGEKIEKQRSSLKELFNLIDCDEDKILTINEIRQGLAGLCIKLDDEDKELVLRALDLNSDGVVSEQEFYKILDPRLQVQKDYRAIIGNSDIGNPIIFEEQVLDMKLSGRMLHNEITKLAMQLKSKLGTEHKLLSRIKILENVLASRQIKGISSYEIKKELECKIIEAQQKKTSDCEKEMQEKSSFFKSFNDFKNKIQMINKEKSAITADFELKKTELAGSRKRVDVISEKEVKLDKANRLTAIVIIQKNIRRYLARIRCLKDKRRLEEAPNVVVPGMRNFASSNKQERLKNLRELKKDTEIKSFIDSNQITCDDNESVHSQQSFQSKFSEESDRSEAKYICAKCSSLADRICLNCKMNSCGLCFAKCRIERHNFSIIASRDINLNNAEKEFILIINQSGNGKEILEAFERCGKRISFVAFRSTMMELRIEMFLIKNVITLSEQYLDEDFMIILEDLLSKFRTQ